MSPKFSYRPFEANIEKTDQLIRVGQSLQACFLRDISVEALAAIKAADVFEAKKGERLWQLSQILRESDNILPRDLELLVSLSIFEALDLEVLSHNWQESPFFAEVKSGFDNKGDIVLWNLRNKEKIQKKEGGQMPVSPPERKALLSPYRLESFVDNSLVLRSSRNSRRLDSAAQVRDWIVGCLGNL